MTSFHKLCVICTRRRGSKRYPLNKVLPESNPPINLFEALKLLSNFAHLNQDECPLSACSTCFVKADRAYSLQILCNKSVEFIRNYIPHVDESKHIISKFPLSENNHQEDKSNNYSGHNVKIEDLSVPAQLANVKIEILSSDDENKVFNDKDSNDVGFAAIKQESNMEISANEPEETILHKGKIYVICIFCNRSIHHNAYMLHKESHTGKKPYQCKTCGKKCSTLEKRNAHMTKKHKGQSICGKLFIKKFQVKQHCASHFANNQIPNDVNECLKRLRVQTDLKQHQNGVNGVQIEPIGSNYNF
ncbi:zinc finger protein with KRAB and SCAN domains 7-like isoform X2 [Atheta coriaria]|uniref:zinc finger protein with KRAB and SCAN domains 7-like isoform X2 n=1 Tax=Dalotia coriaria TaxID=877792 RepID=UPI0031F45771